MLPNNTLLKIDVSFRLSTYLVPFPGQSVLKKQKDTQAITSPSTIEDEGISKENQKSLPGLKTKKSVKFASSKGPEDDEGAWQT